MSWVLGLAAAMAVTAAAPVFRLHLPSEPASVDPHRQRSAAASYLIQSLYRNFYYEDKAGLRGDLGEDCKRSSKNRVLTCRLKKDLKWSDGSPLTSADFIAGYRRLLDPATGAYRPDLLFAVKNARAVLEGKKTPAELGVTAPDPRTVRFELETDDPEFEHVLANVILAPYRPSDDPLKTVFSGPYKLTSWEKSRRLRLEKNPFYPGGAADRPPVEFFFINDDSTALKLYEKNELDFLRRLPTVHIPRYLGKPGFYFQPVTRFDYLGFGPRLRDDPRLREALALSLNYEELEKLFHAKGRPGCVGMPEDWFEAGRTPCFDFDAKKAKAVLGDRKVPKLEMSFSSLGGEDHKRGAEWEQRQWKKNLGVDVRLRMLENKIFLSTLKDEPPDLFRKGVAADRPTCAALLERFEPENPENFLQIKDAGFLKLLKAVRESAEAKDRLAACRKAVAFLMDGYWLIPLGRIHLAILAKPEFTGWQLNELNQLDLASLRAAQ